MAHAVPEDGPLVAPDLAITSEFAQRVVGFLSASGMPWDAVPVSPDVHPPCLGPAVQLLSALRAAPSTLALAKLPPCVQGRWEGSTLLQAFKVAPPTAAAAPTLGMKRPRDGVAEPTSAPRASLADAKMLLHAALVVAFRLAMAAAPGTPSQAAAGVLETLRPLFAPHMHGVQAAVDAAAAPGPASAKAEREARPRFLSYASPGCERLPVVTALASSAAAVVAAAVPLAELQALHGTLARTYAASISALNAAIVEQYEGLQACLAGPGAAAAEAAAAEAAAEALDGELHAHAIAISMAREAPGTVPSGATVRRTMAALQRAAAPGAEPGLAAGWPSSALAVAAKLNATYARLDSLQAMVGGRSARFAACAGGLLVACAARDYVLAALADAPAALAAGGVEALGRFSQACHDLFTEWLCAVNSREWLVASPTASGEEELSFNLPYDVRAALGELAVALAEVGAPGDARLVLGTYLARVGSIFQGGGEVTAASPAELLDSVAPLPVLQGAAAALAAGKGSDANAVATAAAGGLPWTPCAPSAAQAAAFHNGAVRRVGGPGSRVRPPRGPPPVTDPELAASLKALAPALRPLPSKPQDYEPLVSPFAAPLQLQAEAFGAWVGFLEAQAAAPPESYMLGLGGVLGSGIAARKALASGNSAVAAYPVAPGVPPPLLSLPRPLAKAGYAPLGLALPDRDPTPAAGAAIGAGSAASGRLFGGGRPGQGASTGAGLGSPRSAAAAGAGRYPGASPSGRMGSPSGRYPGASPSGRNAVTSPSSRFPSASPLAATSRPGGAAAATSRGGAHSWAVSHAVSRGGGGGAAQRASIGFKNVEHHRRSVMRPAEAAAAAAAAMAAAAEEEAAAAAAAALEEEHQLAAAAAASRDPRRDSSSTAAFEDAMEPAEEPKQDDDAASQASDVLQDEGTGAYYYRNRRGLHEQCGVEWDGDGEALIVRVFHDGEAFVLDDEGERVYLRRGLKTDEGRESLLEEEGDDGEGEEREAGYPASEELYAAAAAAYDDGMNASVASTSYSSSEGEEDEEDEDEGLLGGEDSGASDVSGAYEEGGLEEEEVDSATLEGDEETARGVGVYEGEEAAAEQVEEELSAPPPAKRARRESAESDAKGSSSTCVVM